MAKKSKLKGLYDPEVQEKVLALIEKEYGSESHSMGNEFERTWRIGTGSHEFDFILGGDPLQGWGTPLGRIMRAWGLKFGGKSLYLMNTYREAQNIHITTNKRLTDLAKYLQDINQSSYADFVLEKRDNFLERFPEGMVCVHYDVEKQWNVDLARKLGVDTKKLHIMKGTEIEEIGFKLRHNMGWAHVHGIDSVSMGVTNARLGADVYQSLPMDEARAWGIVWKTVKEQFDVENHTILQVDQVRTKSVAQGTMMKFIDAPAGGKQADHNCDLQIQFSPKGKLYYDSNDVLVDDYAKATVDDVSGQKSPDGMETVIYTEKIRVNKPYLTARVRVDNEKDASYDLSYELLKRAEHFGILHKKGSWFYLVDEDGEIRDGDSEKGKIGWHGAPAVQKAAKEDPVLRDRVLNLWLGYGNEKVMNKMFNSIDQEIAERDTEEDDE